MKAKGQHLVKVHCYGVLLGNDAGCAQHPSQQVAQGDGIRSALPSNLCVPLARKRNPHGSLTIHVSYRHTYCTGTKNRTLGWLLSVAFSTNLGSPETWHLFLALYIYCMILGRSPPFSKPVQRED